MTVDEAVLEAYGLKFSNQSDEVNVSVHRQAKEHTSSVRICPSIRFQIDEIQRDIQSVYFVGQPRGGCM